MWLEELKPSNMFTQKVYGQLLAADLSVQPHRHKSFKLSTDPFFVEKLRNLVGQYLNPPDQQCQATDQSQFQSQSQSQLLQQSQTLQQPQPQPLLPMAPPLCSPPFRTSFRSTGPPPQTQSCRGCSNFDYKFPGRHIRLRK